MCVDFLLSSTNQVQYWKRQIWNKTKKRWETKGKNREDVYTNKQHIDVLKMKKSERINFDTRRKSAKKIHHRFIQIKQKKNEKERAALAEAAKRQQKTRKDEEEQVEDEDVWAIDTLDKRRDHLDGDAPFSLSISLLSFFVQDHLFPSSNCTAV